VQGISKSIGESSIGIQEAAENTEKLYSSITNIETELHETMKADEHLRKLLRQFTH